MPWQLLLRKVENTYRTLAIAIIDDVLTHKSYFWGQTSTHWLKSYHQPYHPFRVIKGNNGEWHQEEIVCNGGEYAIRHVPLTDPLIKDVLECALTCQTPIPPLWERLYDMAVGKLCLKPHQNLRSYDHVWGVTVGENCRIQSQMWSSWGVTGQDGRSKVGRTCFNWWTKCKVLNVEQDNCLPERAKYRIGFFLWILAACRIPIQRALFQWEGNLPANKGCYAAAYSSVGKTKSSLDHGRLHISAGCCDSRSTSTSCDIQGEATSTWWKANLRSALLITVFRGFSLISWIAAKIWNAAWQSNHIGCASLAYESSEQADRKPYLHSQHCTDLNPMLLRSLVNIFLILDR